MSAEQGQPDEDDFPSEEEVESFELDEDQDEETPAGDAEDAGEGSSSALVPVRERSLPLSSDPLTRYIQEVRRLPELDPEEEREIARRYHETGDPEFARRLISANLRLVVKLALMYRRAFRNVMDLIQEGNIGLLEALKRYDPDQGVRFSTYAAWWIKAYMLKYLLDNARLVRVGTTNARRKLLYNLRKEKQKLEGQGIVPTTKLLAERFGVSEEDVEDVDQALSSRDMSVDAPIAEDSERTFADTLASTAPSVEDQVGTTELREKIEQAVSRFRQELSEREQAILDERLMADDPVTLQELGDRFSVTREAMRQSENKLKQRLAKYLREEFGEEFVLQFGGD
jgi:RNA polymerase sigma-32 factor